MKLRERGFKRKHPSRPAAVTILKRKRPLANLIQSSLPMLELGGDATRAHKESVDILKNRDMTRLLGIASR